MQSVRNKFFRKGGWGKALFLKRVSPRFQFLIFFALFLIFLGWPDNWWGYKPSSTPLPAKTAVWLEISGPGPGTRIKAFEEYPFLDDVLTTAGCEEYLLEYNLKLVKPCQVIISPDCRRARVRHLSGEACFCLGLPIDINQASLRDLQYLNGIGPVRARRIVEARKIQGPFTDLRQLRALGIYSKILDDIGPMVTY